MPQPLSPILVWMAWSSLHSTFRSCDWYCCSFSWKYCYYCIFSLSSDLDFSDAPSYYFWMMISYSLHRWVVAFLAVAAVVVLVSSFSVWMTKPLLSRMVEVVWGDFVASSPLPHFRHRCGCCWTKRTISYCIDETTSNAYNYHIDEISNIHTTPLIYFVVALPKFDASTTF